MKLQKLKDGIPLGKGIVLYPDYPPYRLAIGFTQGNQTYIFNDSKDFQEFLDILNKLKERMIDHENTINS